MSFFQQAKNFEINNSTFTNVSGSVRSSLDMLRDNSIPAAAHDSYETQSYKSGCLEGTQTQHIDDITAWTTHINQSSQHRLLWMWGPAGVGKSAIAKSCAEKTAEKGRLGASFFFSHTQHVDDPKRFFITIAHQLIQKVDDYRQVLGSRIQHNQDLHTKGLDIQFHELIIAPFLELAERKMGVQDKMVIIDGLDECNGDPAQSKIMELVAKSVIEHGDKIPLLWAFFSRPESHINREFSPYSSSYLFAKVELPVSESDDGDIRLYFRDKFRPLASADTVWPLDDILDILVAMAAGLWIYAATLVRFIIDQGDLPRQQLDRVLEFHSQWIQSNIKSSVTAELDAFYGMIISRISSKHLPIVQQSLLIHHTTPKASLHILCNIQGLALEDLKHALSKLQSVLMFIPEKRSWEKLFPGSAHISFYDASFMEFLLDKTRSEEYWLEDWRHYAALAIKVLRLFKDLYAMNGISRDEKILKLRELLPVFPDKTFPPSECLMFQDRLFYGVLHRYASDWCQGSGLPSEVIRGFEDILEEFRPFFVDWVEMLPKKKKKLLYLEKRRHSGLVNRVWEFIKRHGYSLPDVPRMTIQYRMLMADQSSGRGSAQTPSLRKLNFVSLDDVGLLAYYSHECEAMDQAEQSSWMEFIEGDDHRLTKAVSRLFDQRRDGHLILPWTDARHLLRAFEASMMGRNGWTSMTELTQATKAYYSTVEGFLNGDPLLLNLRRVAGHITREYGIFDNGCIFRGNLEACGDTLMDGHWEKMEELLHATDDLGNYRMYIQQIIRSSSDGRQQLKSLLRLHVRKRVQGVIEAMSSSGTSGTLVDIQQQLVKKAEWICGGTSTIVNEAFDQVLSDYPDLHDVVNA